MNAQIDGDKVVIRLSGRMDEHQAAAFYNQLSGLLDHGFAEYMFDLSQLNYIDSSGIGFLIEAKKRSAYHGGKVTIVGLKGVVKELFEMTKLTKYFAVEQSASAGISKEPP